MKPSLSCTVCRRPYDGPMNHCVCPECGGSIECASDLTGNPEHLREVIRKGSENGIWGYRDFFAIDPKLEPVSMGEGNTPLVKASGFGEHCGLKQLYIKNETINPSGTYKDRFATVAMTQAKADGINKVALGSAGNAAAAVAAYAARAGMNCYIILPPGAVAERAMQNMAYGGHFIYGMGDVFDCVQMAEDGEELFGWKNMCTTMINNPLGCDGYKTIAYECARTLQFDAPDYVICPVGGGILISKVFRGFEEMKELGLIKSIPKIIAAQAEGCAPVVKAFREGKRQTETWKNGKTIAFAIFDPVTFEGVTVLDVLRKSGGDAIDVSDDEILDAMRLCARTEAILPEPASAASLAVAVKMAREGKLKPEDRVVCIATGSGLRDLKLYSSLDENVPKVEPGNMQQLSEAVARYKQD